jgi:hypothetical protein
MEVFEVFQGKGKMNCVCERVCLDAKEEEE